jgi:hypothetical protein
MTIHVFDAFQFVKRHLQMSSSTEKSKVKIETSANMSHAVSRLASTEIAHTSMGEQDVQITGGYFVWPIISLIRAILIYFLGLGTTSMSLQTSEAILIPATDEAIISQDAVTTNNKSGIKIPFTSLEVNASPKTTQTAASIKTSTAETSSTTTSTTTAAATTTTTTTTTTSTTTTVNTLIDYLCRNNFL